MPSTEVEVREGIVATDYIRMKAEAILSEIERKPFGHFAISGPEASGKMSLVKLVMQLYQDRYHT